MSRLYKVEFETHCNCSINNMVYYCMACNAKEAREAARLNWTRKPYMFALQARRAEEQDPEAVTVTTWLNHTFTGPEAMNAFFCTGTRTWRVNGRNLY